MKILVERITFYKNTNYSQISVLLPDNKFLWLIFVKKTVMNNSNQESAGPISFYERYTDFSDQQIKEVLKNHKNYQEQAVVAAVKIAIERELIHSEQDLLAPEYQSKAFQGWTLFPEILISHPYKKLVASIFRVLFLSSLIPIIFGVLKYAEGQLNMTYLGVGLGLIWLILTFIVFKTQKLIILFIQIILLILVSIGIGYRLFNQQFYKVTDVAVLVIGSMVILYFLLYLKKLIQTKPDQLSGQ